MKPLGKFVEKKDLPNVKLFHTRNLGTFKRLSNGTMIQIKHERSTDLPKLPEADTPD